MISDRRRHIRVAFPDHATLVEHLPRDLFWVNLRCLWIHQVFQCLLQVRPLAGLHLSLARFRVHSRLLLLVTLDHNEW